MKLTKNILHYVRPLARFWEGNLIHNLKLLGSSLQYFCKTKNFLERKDNIKRYVGQAQKNLYYLWCGANLIQCIRLFAAVLERKKEEKVYSLVNRAIWYKSSKRLQFREILKYQNTTTTVKYSLLIDEKNIYLRNLTSF